MSSSMAFDDAMIALARKTWGSKRRMAFYRRLAAYVENGMPLRLSVQRLKQQAMSRPGWEAMKRYDTDVLALSEIDMAVASGKTLATALEGWAPAPEVSLIYAGEKSGTLPQALRSAIDGHGVISRIRNKLLAEMIEPAIMGALGVYLVYLVGTQMVPPMEQIAPARTWPFMAKLLLPMNYVVHSPLTLWVLGALVVLAVVVVATLSIWTGRLRAKFDSFAPWSVYRVIQASGWIIGFSNLIASGIRVSDALALQAQWSTPWMRERLDAARVRVQGGAELGAAFREAGHNFPDPILIDDIAAFSGFQDFAALFKKLGKEWSDENEARVIGTVHVIGLMANIVVNAVILLTVMGMMALQGVMMAQAH